MTSSTLQAVSEFVFHENQLLDQGRFTEWLALFDPAGVYWVPAAGGQEDAEQQVSIIHEDVVMLEMRIGRLLHPRAHGLSIPIRTSRMTSNLRVLGEDAGTVRVEARFVLHEWQPPRLRDFAGSIEYVLSAQQPYRILQKRVDLVNVEEAFEVIQIIL